MNKLKYVLFLILMVSGFRSLSQEQDFVILDKIIAIVGDEVVLRSDIDRQIADYSFTDSLSKELARCEILKQNIYQKLLLNQARIDSLKVTEDMINGELNRRLRYFVSQIGSEDALEKYYGKTIAEIKDEMREPIREVLLVEQMKDQILGSFEISPREVRIFFNNIPADSLPFYNSEVEYGRIVLYPKANKEEENAAKEKARYLRERISNGERFENLAILYSEDESSATKGGDLQMQNKNVFVPEFAAMAMNLKADSVSMPFKTRYGYHIVKLVARKGELIHVKHILIIPKITGEARVKTKNKLLDIRTKILSDSISFEDAAAYYSEDENSKNNGGVFLDRESGSSRIPLDKIEASIFFIIDSMKTGDISLPVKKISMDRRESYEIIKLISKTEPHKANLRDDFPKIKSMAEEARHQEILGKWADKTIKETYITIYPPYDSCYEREGFIKKYK
jgi:peptidyl-prolyl cis-trans isomerase SurA